jgi:prepilin-type N-terminal cleavage/methylation domain-containing protein/prepilin-type processing-associated H-X9-DG protein
MPRGKLQRQGFTLIELIVVIAIIAVIIGLLLPAVQQVRQSAARIQCANNLKQIGLALHGYHDDNQALPPGVKCTNASEWGETDAPGWGWAANLLPYVDQDNLYKKIAFDHSIADPNNAVARVTPVSVFLCPADSATPTWNAAQLGADEQPGTPICGVAPANYLGMSTSEDGYEGVDTIQWNGVLYPNSSVRLIDIRDGTSQTFAVTERLFRDGQVTWAGAVPGAAVFAAVPGKETDVNTAMTLGDAGDASKPGEVDGGWPSIQHTSAHGVGANFLFCDGHVQFITPAISFVTFKALVTRSGGEAVNADY